MLHTLYYFSLNKAFLNYLFRVSINPEFAIITPTPDSFDPHGCNNSARPSFPFFSQTTVIGQLSINECVNRLSDNVYRNRWKRDITPALVIPCFSSYSQRKIYWVLFDYNGSDVFEVSLKNRPGLMYTFTCNSSPV